MNAVWGQVVSVNPRGLLRRNAREQRRIRGSVAALGNRSRIGYDVPFSQDSHIILFFYQDSQMSDTIANDEELHITAPEHSLPPCALEELPKPCSAPAPAQAGRASCPCRRMRCPISWPGRDLMVQSRTGSGKNGRLSSAAHFPA